MLVLRLNVSLMCTHAIVVVFSKSVCFCLLRLLLRLEKTPHPSCVKS